MPLHADDPEPAPPTPYGYLFAHMTSQDYGRLYYSVSRDGLHWEQLNNGERVLGEEYRGHPDICVGHDGRYYLVGNIEGNHDLEFFVSDDLVTWEPHSQHQLDMAEAAGVPNAGNHGAPKVFFDREEATYLVTWHSSSTPRTRENPEAYWGGQRTYFSTSPDLKTFSPPGRLFPSWDFATIDVIVRKDGQRYAAIIKDEKYPSFGWPTGKSIRIAFGPTAQGPWGYPEIQISPNFREAPTLVPRQDGNGWYLYYEQYPGVQYGLSTAPALEGPWYSVYIREYAVPPDARHGCMVTLDRAEWTRLIDAFGPMSK